MKMISAASLEQTNKDPGETTDPTTNLVLNVTCVKHCVQGLLRYLQPYRIAHGALVLPIA